MTGRAGWIALGVTAVAVSGAYLWGDALPQLDALVPAHIAATDGVGVIDGNELTLTDVRVTSTDENPSGTQTLLVSFDVVPDPDSGLCLGPLLVEAGGAGRTWQSAGSIPGWDSFGNDLCGSDEGPATATIGFLVPNDVTAPLRVEVGTTTLFVDPLWFELPSDALG